MKSVDDVDGAQDCEGPVLDAELGVVEDGACHVLDDLDGCLSVRVLL